MCCGIVSMMLNKANRAEFTTALPQEVSRQGTMREANCAGRNLAERNLGAHEEGLGQLMESVYFSVEEE